MILVLLGFISGIISGLGMGGGTILILSLSLLLSMNQKIAQATNLIFFIPTSLAAIFINRKEKNINFKISKIIIFWGILGAILGALIAKQVDVKLLKKFFGVFIMMIAIHESYILIKPYKNKTNRDNRIRK